MLFWLIWSDARYPRFPLVLLSRFLSDHPPYFLFHVLWFWNRSHSTSWFSACFLWKSQPSNESKRQKLMQLPGRIALNLLMKYCNKVWWWRGKNSRWTDWFFIRIYSCVFFATFLPHLSKYPISSSLFHLIIMHETWIPWFQLPVIIGMEIPSRWL